MHVRVIVKEEEVVAPFPKVPVRITVSTAALVNIQAFVNVIVRVDDENIAQVGVPLTVYVMVVG